MTWEDREDTKPTALELLFTYGGSGGGNLTYRVVELKTLILEMGVQKKKDLGTDTAGTERSRSSSSERTPTRPSPVPRVPGPV